MKFCEIAAILAILTTSCLAYGQAPKSTGLEFIDDAAYHSIPLAAAPLLGELPTATDLSNSFPTPGNQGAQSSCVGWATAYAFKSFQERQERKWSFSNKSHLFSPAYVYNQINVSQNCKGGTNFVDALNLLRREGVAPLDRFPYQDSDCSRRPDAATKQVAKAFAIADWRRVNVQDETEIKSHLASGFPVLIGMVIDEGFTKLAKGQVHSVRSGALVGGHAMVAVGYSDDRAAFKVINSWGTEWADSGFGWISYPLFRQSVREGYVAQDIVVVPSSQDTIPSTIPDTVQPLPIQPSATVGVPNHVHNVIVPSPLGPVPGMRITVPANVLNATGKTSQVVVKFSYLNGPPLFANPQEATFRDIGGLVASGTAARVVGSNSESFSNAPISIPYYALNFQSSNGMATYNLAFIALVYIDNLLVAQSAPIPFVLKW